MKKATQLAQLKKVANGDRPPARLASPPPLSRASSRALALAAPAPSSAPAAATAPQRASFERGWRLLRAGEPAQAATAFEEVDQTSHGDAIQEDALFWQAVALARAGRAPAARQLLATFATRFPRSARAGEASAMLGWLLLEQGDTEAARRAFQQAASDPVDRVRTSARTGLARLSPPTSSNPAP
jgi:TolA-binding protein